MPPTENDKTYTIKNKRDALDYVAFGVEVITVIVLFVYTSITVGLYCQTKKALRETKNANYIATRAANTAKELQTK